MRQRTTVGIVPTVQYTGYPYWIATAQFIRPFYRYNIKLSSQRTCIIFSSKKTPKS